MRVPVSSVCPAELSRRDSVFHSPIVQHPSLRKHKSSWSDSPVVEVSPEYVVPRGAVPKSSIEIKQAGSARGRGENARELRLLRRAGKQESYPVYCPSSTAYSFSYA